MSTRALYTFKANPVEDYQQDWNVYKHHDGYPTGAAESIASALELAWNLPRYESDEFAASFIAANKPRPNPEYLGMKGGGVRLMPQGDPLKVASKHCSDIEYRYEIYMQLKGRIGAPIGLFVRGFSVNIAWREGETDSETKLFDVAIADLQRTANELEKVA